MIFVWYIVCEALSSNLPATHKWNADATSYEFKSREINGKAIYFKENPESFREQKKPRNSAVDTYLSLTVKVMVMANANGDSSDLVAIISIPSLGANQWHVENIKGLTNKPGTGTGSLYFCDSRAGNPELWRHWYKNIVIPTLTKYSDYFNLNDEYGLSLPTFFSTDGEDIILRQIYEGNDILTSFERLRVFYGKVDH